MFKTNAAGNVVADPILRNVQNPYTGNMDKVANFRLACRVQNTNKTVFIECSGWGGLADLISKWVYKGRYVNVEGVMQARHSVGVNGKIYDHMQLKIDVIELVGKNKESGEAPAAAQPAAAPTVEATEEIPEEGTVAQSLEEYTFDASQLPF